MKRIPKLSDYRAAIFDLDGTLADSMWIWGEIDRAYLSRFGIACPPELQSEIAGKSFPEVARYFKERFSIPEEPAQMMRSWEEMALDAYREKIPLKPGARELLGRLQRRGIKAAVATSNSRELAGALLRARFVRGYFHAVVTADEVRAGKPEPDIYLEAARRLSVRPSECLVFEDIPEGIAAGKRAGMRVCAVYDAASAALDAEKRRLADFRIHSFLDLYEEKS